VAQGPQSHGRLRLGHYSSIDGAIGFVLDRTADKPLARYDGERRVIELAVRDAPLGAVELVGPGGRLFARVAASGGLVVFHARKPNGTQARRDADVASCEARPVCCPVVVAP
jgi:hypothetical protein